PTRRSSDLKAEVFPEFVRVFGQIWYKMRSCFPGFVRVLGQIWYKKRKGGSSRLRGEKYSNLAQHQIGELRYALSSKAGLSDYINL
ncbi:hypothetical protein HMPREF1586_01400, partial [Gardnerella vaginalis JCP8522]